MVDTSSMKPLPVNIVSSELRSTFAVNLWMALFVGLKLGGCIGWSWWEVCIPIYVHLAFLIPWAIAKAAKEVWAEEAKKAGVKP